MRSQTAISELKETYQSFQLRTKKKEYSFEISKFILVYILRSISLSLCRKYSCSTKITAGKNVEGNQWQAVDGIPDTAKHFTTTVDACQAVSGFHISWEVRNEHGCLWKGFCWCSVSCSAAMTAPWSAPLFYSQRRQPRIAGGAATGPGAASLLLWVKTEADLRGTFFRFLLHPPSFVRPTFVPYLPVLLLWSAGLEKKYQEFRVPRSPLPVVPLIQILPKSVD